jgi:hypothetical protein
MEKEKLIDYLVKNGLTDIEELPYKGKALVLRCFYDFDDEELKAARAYSNDEAGEDKEEESDSWYEEFFLPYLNDLAIDNVGEILEDTMEEFETGAQYISYEADMENHEYVEFIAVFFSDEDDVEIEKVLDELNL